MHKNPDINYLARVSSVQCTKRSEKQQAYCESSSDSPVKSMTIGVESSLASEVRSMMTGTTSTSHIWLRETLRVITKPQSHCTNILRNSASETPSWESSLKSKVEMRSWHLATCLGLYKIGNRSRSIRKSVNLETPSYIYYCIV